MRVRAKEAKEWAGALRGVIDTFPTPYTEDGEIDEGKLREIVRYHYEGMESDGLYVLGGAAEAWFQTREERKRSCEILIDEANKIKPDAPVIVGTLCVSAKETVELTRHAEAAGATAVILRNPLLATDENGIYDFYKYVAANTDIPIVLMNLQGVGGVFYMSPEFLARLSEEVTTYCAVKNMAGGNHSIALKKLAGDNMVVSCFDAYALMGGIINPQGLIDPILLGRGSFLFQKPGNLIMRRFCYACIEGRLAEAADIYFNQLIHLLKLYYEGVVIRPNPAGTLEYSQSIVKYWASLLGVPVGSPLARPPISAPTEAEKEKVKAGLVSAGLIKG
ncbi:MAG: dihydrodipicolinate synthase family protein [Chloroflexota bacterium]